MNQLSVKSRETAVHALAFEALALVINKRPLTLRPVRIEFIDFYGAGAAAMASGAAADVAAAPAAGFVSPPMVTTGGTSSQGAEHV